MSSKRAAAEHADVDGVDGALMGVGMNGARAPTSRAPVPPRVGAWVHNVRAVRVALNVVIYAQPLDVRDVRDVVGVVHGANSSGHRLIRVPQNPVTRRKEHDDVERKRAIGWVDPAGRDCAQ